MIKRYNIAKLYAMHGMSEDLMELTDDYHMIDETGPSVFRSLNHDGYSALDIDTDVAGARCVEWLLDALECEEHKIDEITIQLFVELVLNRKVTHFEQRIIAAAVVLVDIGANYSETIGSLIHSYCIADNTMESRFLVPVQLSLFLITPSSDQEKFIKEMNAISMYIYRGLSLIRCVDENT